MDNYEAYVHIQSESAVRHLASSYAYDHGEPNELTLRSSVDEVSTALQKELQARLAKAGVVVDEARLTHLAYAPEIAGVMLPPPAGRGDHRRPAKDRPRRRQHGADGPARPGREQRVVELDEERKATMVSNLLVVLCSDRDAQPVVNAGTLYT